MWNSGMFVWTAAQIIKAIETHLPRLANAMQETVHSLETDQEFAAVQRAYSRIDAVSVDYGVMEKADNVLCIPLAVGWNDVGSWASLKDVWGSDDQENSSKGDVVHVDARSCIVSSPHKLAVLIGVEDLIVVDTPDALMVCQKDSAQDVKMLQEALIKKGYRDLL